MTDKKIQPELPVAQEKPPLPPPSNVPKEYFNHPSIRQKFAEILGPSRMPGFLASILQVINGNETLKKANVISIYNAAATAATLDLPVNQNLGFAWIVPYKGQALFQMGAKGYVQLAMRTGQYLRLNVVEVYKSQFLLWNELTEEFQANFNIIGEGDVVGYVAYFELLNGFRKTVYWSVQKVIVHAKKYSKNYDNNTSVWKTDFDAMAKKTVLKNMLSKWGIMSIEMNKALVVDQAVIRNDEGTDVFYPDNETDNSEKAAGAADAALTGMKEVTGKAAANQS